MALAEKQREESSVRRVNAVDVFVGSRIKTLRIAAGMSQEQLAGELGITFQQIQKYENGVNRIAASRLYSICEVFGVGIASVFPDAAGEQETVLDVITADVDFVRTLVSLPPAQRRALRDLARALASEGGHG